jgi:hypothetical protein
MVQELRTSILKETWMGRSAPPPRYFGMPTGGKERKKAESDSAEKSVPGETEKESAETRVPGFGDRKKRTPR